MKNKTLVSIGIAAFNEQNNIANVLSDIAKQNRDRWKLHEIIVFSDGSTDNTVSVIKSLNMKLVTVVEGKKRKGKTQRLNELFATFTGNILVMFDADIRLSGQHVVTRLIQPMLRNQSVMVVGGNSRPFYPVSFFQNAVYSTFMVFYESRKKVRKGNNIFGCTGSCMAIRKTFAKSIMMPKIINEDAYIYLTCIAKGFLFRYVDTAIVFYKLPKTVRDYIKQVFRSEPQAVSIDLNTYFTNTILTELRRPLLFYAMSVMKVFAKNPLGVSFIVIINLFCKPLFPVVNKYYSLNWFTAQSTK